MDDMAVFESDNYKQLVVDLCEQRSIPYARVAEAAGIHRQYLTKVLQSKGHLSDEQAHLVAEFFGLSQDAIAYLLLLVQEAKTTLPRTQRYFTKRRLAIRRAHADLIKKLRKETRVVTSHGSPEDLAEYFLEVQLQLSHAHLFIPAFQKDPRLLMPKLSIGPDELASLIGRLRALGLVEVVGQRTVSKSPFLHLEKDSSLSRQNHRNWRVFAAHAATIRRDFDFSFTSTVTADEPARKSLVEKLKAVVGEFHQQLPSAANDEVFQVNLDVLRL